MLKISLGKTSAAALFAALLLQNTPALELSVGARLGGSVSGIMGDTSKMMVPRFGLNGAFFASEWINQSFGLQQELGFGSRGEAWKNPDSVDWKLFDQFAGSFMYLEVPLLAKWRFIQNEKFRPVLYGGFDIGFPIIAESEYLGNTSDMSAKTQPVDFGLTAGMSLDIKPGTKAIIPIDIRYTWGATNFLNNPDYPLALHHSVFSISAGFGWILDFSKKSEF